MYTKTMQPPAPPPAGSGTCAVKPPDSNKDCAAATTDADCTGATVSGNAGDAGNDCVFTWIVPLPPGAMFVAPPNVCPACAYKKFEKVAAPGVAPRHNREQAAERNAVSGIWEGGTELVRRPNE